MGRTVSSVMDNRVVGIEIETKIWQTITKLNDMNGDQQWAWYGAFRQQLKYVDLKRTLQLIW